MKKILLIGTLVLIGGIIWSIEFKKTKNTINQNGEIIALGIIADSNNGNNEIVKSGKNINESAPNWRLESFEGEIVELNEFRGKPVMIDFFADWCPFCHTEFPHIEDAHQKYRDRGLVVIGIHRTDTESVAKGGSFARDEAGATFMLIKDTSGEVYGTYTSGPAMPISFFINEEGVIVDKILGPKTPEALEESINKILQTK